MTWTIAKKLYAALLVMGVLLAVSTVTVYRQVSHLGETTAAQTRLTSLLRLSNLQLFYQAASLAATRGNAIEKNDRFKSNYQDDLDHIDQLGVQVKALIVETGADLEAYRQWESAYERFRREIAAPYWVEVARGGQPRLNNDWQLQRDLIPPFNAFMDQQREMDRALDLKASRLRTTTQMGVILATLASLLLGASIFILVLRNIKRRLHLAVESTGAATTQIAATLTEHDHILTNQSSAISEMVSTITELNTNSSQASESGETVTQRAGASLAAVRQWGESLKGDVEDMGTLKGTVEAIARQIQELSEQTGQIGSILGAVSEIAGQTNLLALNAAVEAARAGEHGRGFAVVASEIRKLADQSKRSLERIGTMVAQIQKATNATVMTAEEGSKRVEVTIRAAQDSMGTVGQIVATLEETIQNTQQIVLSLRQQGMGIRQVNEAVGSIHVGMKESVTGMTQIRSGVRSLQDMGNDIRRMVQ